MDPPPQPAIDLEPREPRLWRAGIFLVGLLFLQLGLVFALEPKAGAGLLTGLGLEFVTGREAAFPAALSAGAPPLLLAIVSTLQNLAVAAFILPLVSRLLHRWKTHDHFLARRLRRIEEQALSRRNFVEKWGPLGLFAFMLVPFLPNGALIASVIGRLCGLPLRNIVAPVVVATIIVAFAWAFALDAILAWTGRVDSRLPALLATLLVLVFLLWAVVAELRDHVRTRA